jgi:hypothetical protein
VGASPGGNVTPGGKALEERDAEIRTLYRDVEAQHGEIERLRAEVAAVTGQRDRLQERNDQQYATIMRAGKRLQHRARVVLAVRRLVDDAVALWGREGRSGPPCVEVAALVAVLDDPAPPLSTEQAIG